MPSYETEIEVRNVDGCEEGVDVPITVHYVCCKAVRGTTDGPYGPKLEPDEPAHIEIDWIEGPDGRSMELTEGQEERIMEEINDREPEREGWL